MELILAKILESQLELNPKNVARIEIGINSIFFGMTKGLFHKTLEHSNKIQGLLIILLSARSQYPIKII